MPFFTSSYLHKNSRLFTIMYISTPIRIMTASGGKKMMRIVTLRR